jgi:hypothetical protein
VILCSPGIHQRRFLSSRNPPLVRVLLKALHRAARRKEERDDNHLRENRQEQPGCDRAREDVEVRAAREAGEQGVDEADADEVDAGQDGEAEAALARGRGGGEVERCEDCG